MPKSMAVAFAIMVALVMLAFILLAAWTGGERYVISSLLKEGYSVVIDQSVPAGEGRYKIRIRERGAGWVVVDVLER